MATPSWWHRQRRRITEAELFRLAGAAFVAMAAAMVIILSQSPSDTVTERITGVSPGCTGTATGSATTAPTTKTP